MAIEILVPRLGWTMEEGIFGEWLKRDGDAIAVGDLLYTIETDKATQEVESLEAGVLRIAPGGPQAGDVVQVGALLGHLTSADEAVPVAALPPLPSPPPQGGAAPSAEAPGFSSPASRTAQPAASPRARRVAGELGVDWTQLNGSGRTGRIVERDVRAAAAAKPVLAEIKATPVARRLAEEVGIDLADVAPARPGARIQREDVEAAIAARTPAPPPVAETTDTQYPIPNTHPLTRIRRLIAQRMAESSHTTAPVTLTTDADATGLVALREQLKTSFGPRSLPVPSYNDLFIKLTAAALEAHPQLNATWTETGIVLHDAVHIGLAVDTPEGLLVPVVRDVQAKSLRQIAAESQALIERIQNHRIGPDELQGGTFTITNLGIYNIDAFTPIINLPQAAILGIGRIAAKPAVVNGAVVPRQTVALSLTFDHRVVDGAPAARFLNAVREFVEEPALWLAG